MPPVHLLRCATVWEWLMLCVAVVAVLDMLFFKGKHEDMHRVSMGLIVVAHMVLCASAPGIITWSMLWGMGIGALLTMSLVEQWLKGW
jgi:hypothetical protein